ncbi:MAG: uroporphyrinogen decarboxylase [Alphaproteobacteria bacterium]|nr:uroporphyrinogen decarboxylase [Alphaproteobacteria bacterium]
MKADKPILRALRKEASLPPPVWLMRQAGRYLPEYRAVREKAGSFWTMCMTPELACEITLQPITRFGFDAAILFSDILVVPAALGLKVWFEEGVGPRLIPVHDTKTLERDPEVWRKTLTPVYGALELVRQKLDDKTALLGFAGAPWTLATYMAQGGGSPDQREAKLWGYRDPQGFQQLLEIVGDCVTAHLIAQIDAGADAVQIFDSWASGLPAERFADWVVAPAKRIVEKIRASRPAAKIIGFPRASTLEGYLQYADETGVDAVSIDTSAPIAWAAKNLAERVTVQGNLDPIVLIAGGAALERAVDRIVDQMRGHPFIFNLGHGILPETPVDHVHTMLTRIRAAA